MIASTPGAPATAPAAPVEITDQPSSDPRTCVEPICSRPAFSLDEIAARPMVATAVTSARPIMSAAAVAAVRPGFRAAFSCASLPDVPPSFADGQPTTATTGRTRRGAVKAAPRNSSRMPSRDARITPATPSPLPSMPSSRSAAPPMPAAAPTKGARRPNRPLGGVDPSRTAAIGSTRVARTAGAMPASTVTTTPTSSDTTTVRVAKTVEACGRVSPTASKSAFSPLASTKPRPRPTTEASAPITSDSSSTERRTWRREAPSVRRVASSRVRCATVIDSVLKITKEPTNRATPPKPSRM